jgi:hypothetical protein
MEMGLPVQRVCERYRFFFFFFRVLDPRGVWEKSGRHDLGGEGGPAIPLTKFLFISYKGRDAPQGS